MTAPVRQTRNGHEVAHQRACAGTLRSRATPYEREEAHAVLAALDWVERRRALAPVSGDPVEPTDRAVHAERVHAEEVEDRALRAGLDATFPGVVAAVLSWYQHRAFTEAPY